MKSYIYFVSTLALLSLVLAACSPAPILAEEDAMPRGSATVNGSDVDYFEGISGYMAAPTENPDAPGVILIHEWWGLNEQMKETADRVASHGYRVLAVDLYNGKVATTREQAQQYRNAVTQDGATVNLRAAQAYLVDQGSDRVASWGYCFGGGQSMDLALSDVPIDAAVVYYGSLQNAIASPEDVTKPLLLVFGTADITTTAESAQELVSLLPEGSVEIHLYEGMGHAFANPSNPDHNKTATRDAWDKTLAFLNEQLI